jgi:hypothetical protein
VSDTGDARQEITRLPEDVESELHQIARDHFVLLLRSGRTPCIAAGGRFAGLAYFPVLIEGGEYWLTQEGLLPRHEWESADHVSVEPQGR